MDIKTLMIGDWVYVTKNFTQKYHKIRALSNDEGDVLRGIYVNEYGVKNPSIFSPNDTEPIPLTSDILKKIGFYGGEYKHYCGNVWHLELEGFREIGFTYSNGKGVLWGEKIKINYPTSIGDKFVIPNITCLHVLQHALRLCGASKEIEL